MWRLCGCAASGGADAPIVAVYTFDIADEMALEGQQCDKSFDVRIHEKTQ